VSKVDRNQPRRAKNSEWLHDADDAAQFDERDQLFSRLRELPLTRQVSDTALSALRELRAKELPRYWRVDLPDALIAATAASCTVNVLTDNRRDFDKLAGVLSFQPVHFPAEQASGNGSGR
jgi:predicted nucleic acid-binding protein